MQWNSHAQDPASFFSEFSLKAAHAGRPTSLAANNTINIIDGMATIPPWFLRQMTAPTAITTWSRFLMLVTNHYNFQKATGALLRMPGGPTIHRQTYQRGSSMNPRALISPVVKQQTPQIKQEQMQARRRNIECYTCGKKGTFHNSVDPSPRSYEEWSSRRARHQQRRLTLMRSTVRILQMPSSECGSLWAKGLGL